MLSHPFMIPTPLFIPKRSSLTAILLLWVCCIAGMLLARGTTHAASPDMQDKRKQIFSPHQQIRLDVFLQDERLYYQAWLNQEAVLQASALGLVFEKEDTLGYFRLLSHTTGYHDTVWTSVWGQQRHIRDHYQWLLLDLEDTRHGRPLQIHFRVYDDGIAFRYEYPDSSQALNIMSELSSFCLAGDYRSWWIWADYGTLEKLYFETPLSQAPHVAAPFTMETTAGQYISIYEAALDQYSSMTLRQQQDKQCYQVNLVPWADGVAVKTQGAFRSPWRVVQMAPQAGELITSSLILNLNEPAPPADYSWIKPLTYVGIWWEMHLGLSEWGLANNRHGASTQNAKRYIDFAAQNGIGGVLIEGWNTGWENWGQAGAFDFVTPYPDFDILEVVAYARQKGVEIIGHHETGGDVIAYEEKLEQAFQYYHDLGIRYVKTGYAGPVNPPTEWHHGQYMVDHYNKVMRTAMQYQIMLDVHEPVIPSGLSRTYPNLMTFEGVRGMEWNAWSEGNPPSHTTILPFTRGLAGPMDYTPGIFNIKLDRHDQNRVAWNTLDPGNTQVHSTLSNQLALMVILYSPMQMAADLPENYQEHPALEFIANMPATWDETRVLAAEIGQYLVIARRAGHSWYVAGITNEEARSLELDLHFLDNGKRYAARICQDKPASHYQHNPEAYQIRKKKTGRKKTHTITLAPGGGFLMILQQ